MKFALTDLTYEELLTAVTAVNDTGGISIDPPAMPTEPSNISIPVTTPSTALATCTSGGSQVGPTTTETATAPVMSNAPTVETDALNIPWDERIHASTKTKTKAGAWKKRKGVDATKIAEIENELRLNIPPSFDRTNEVAPEQPAQPAPVQQPAQPAPVQQPAQPIAQPEQPAQPAPVQQPAQPAPVQGGEQSVPQSPSSLQDRIATAQGGQCHTNITHKAMMNQVNTALQNPNNIVTATDLPAICTAFNMQSLNDCINDPVIIGKIHWILGGV